jgi:hypothetical protein
MSRKPEARKGNVLRKYEGTNLLFFLVFVIALGVFVSLVFQSYKNSGENSSKESADGNGIVSEVVSPAAESCLFYLGTKLSESSHRYRSQLDIPVTDDGLARDLFAISGVVEVIVDQKLVILQKSSAAHWEAIQPSAREVISHHLHMH